VVGILSDDEITKNKSMPVMKQRERYALLEDIKWIDEIVYDVPYCVTCELLDDVGAEFSVHGDDMPVDCNGVGKGVWLCTGSVGAYDDVLNAGRLKIIRRTEGVSTTEIIGRLLLLTKDHLQLGINSTDRPQSARAGGGSGGGE